MQLLAIGAKLLIAQARHGRQRSRRLACGLLLVRVRVGGRIGVLGLQRHAGDWVARGGLHHVVRPAFGHGAFVSRVVTAVATLALTPLLYEVLRRVFGIIGQTDGYEESGQHGNFKVLTDALCAVREAVRASSSHSGAGTLLIAVIHEGYLLPGQIRHEIDLPVFIAGNADFDEAVKAAENFVQLLFVNVRREVADVQADHTFHCDCGYREVNVGIVFRLT